MHLLVAFDRKFKCASNHPLATSPREDCGLHRNFLRETVILKSANVGILTFGVLSHYH